MEKIGRIYFHGNRKDTEIALTFDDGPCEETKKILKILKKEKVKATFFILGIKIRGNEKTLKEMKKLGCEIGNHSWDHSAFILKKKNSIQTQLEKTDSELEKLKIKTDLIRPPRVLMGFSLMNVAKKLNKKIIICDIDSRDWRLVSKEKIIKRILKKTKTGSIIGFHDYIETVGKNTSIVEVLKEIIPKLKKKYKLVTVSELLKN